MAMIKAVMVLAVAGPVAAQSVARSERAAAELEVRALALKIQDLGRTGLGAELRALQGLRAVGTARGGIRSQAPAAWDDQDPADSTYRAARTALNRSNYSRAAFLFAQVYEKYPKSTYAGDAHYYQAFALYRQGNTDGLRRALEVLERQGEKFAEADTRDDATSLAARINAELAKRGDASAEASIRSTARSAATSPTSPVTSTGRGHAVSGPARRGDCDDEDDEKAAAIEALLSMDRERAVPILRKVLARRDPESACLRRKAVFIVSQHSGEESESILLAAASGDPDKEVRENAVFWLGQSGGAHAVVALDSILRLSKDDEIKDKAIFALSQHNSTRANEILRDYAQRADAPVELRENAIFWLGQSSNAENGDFLRSIYKSTRERSLKDKIIFSLAQGGRRDSGKWLVEIATSADEDIETRKNALFWLGQSGTSTAELFTLYDRLNDRELREQMIFVYSQRKDRAAADKLVEIAKSDKDRELRKKAIFWLGQSNDPRIVQILEDILSKP